MLNLSESFSTTIPLNEPGSLNCDFSISETLLEKLPDEARHINVVVLEKMPSLWAHLSRQIEENRWVQLISTVEQTFNLSLILVSDEEIRAMNREYRNKDEATDVLTFTLLEETAEESGMAMLPELDLGEIYISVEWAKAAICKENAAISDNPLNFYHGLTLFILERITHGCLHLLGVHHDTMASYNKVVAIQQAVLNALY